MEPDKIDFDTNITCPVCEALVKHRYECDCNRMGGYCKKQSHNFFYCIECEEEAKVTWEDEPQKGVVFLTREERKRIDETFAMSDVGEVGRKEREALKAMFRTMEVPGEVEDT